MTSPRKCLITSRVASRRNPISRFFIEQRFGRCSATKDLKKSNWKTREQESVGRSKRRRSFLSSPLIRAQNGCLRKSSATRKDSSKPGPTSAMHQHGVKTNGDLLRSKLVFQEFLQPAMSARDQSSVAPQRSAKAEWPLREST